MKRNSIEIYLSTLKGRGIRQSQQGNLKEFSNGQLYWVKDLNKGQGQRVIGNVQTKPLGLVLARTGDSSNIVKEEKKKRRMGLMGHLVNGRDSTIHVCEFPFPSNP